jgi:hypothetical protein
MSSILQSADRPGNNRCNRRRSEPEAGRHWVCTIWACRSVFWSGQKVGDFSHKCLSTASRAAYVYEASVFWDVACLVYLKFTDVLKVLSTFERTILPWREHGVVSQKVAVFSICVDSWCSSSSYTSSVLFFGLRSVRMSKWRVYRKFSSASLVPFQSF